MLPFLVGLRHQLLHHLVLLDSLPPLLFGLPHHLRAVVLLGLVLHLVVHAGLLPLQHLLREAHRVDKLRHGQARQLLQRVEEVHHEQVLPRSLVYVFLVGIVLVGRAVVLRSTAFKLAAQLGQLLDDHSFGQREQRRHLRIGKIVLLALLHLGEVAEQQPLVHREMVAPQVVVQQLPQGLHPAVLHLPLASLHTPQLLAHHLLLLAHHVVVVQHPLVGAAHKALTLGLFDQQHIVPRDLFHAFLERLVYTFHTCKNLR